MTPLERPEVGHVVMFSGGIGSWAAARRVVDANGPDDVTLLFADTKMEDGDLYRFLDDAALELGVPVTRIAEGRDIWQVFTDARFLGNSRIDPCSRVLKRQFMRRWLEEHFEPADTIVYLGYEWSEPHRVEKAARHWAPWQVEAPLLDKPYLSKRQMLEDAESRGLTAPRLYGMGFTHNNCGGGCVKAGIGQFVQLHEKMPERYAEWERHEQELRDDLGNVAILTDRRGGEKKPMSLATLRARIEAGDATLPKYEIAGCACLEEPEPSR